MKRFSQKEQQKLMSDFPKIFKNMARKFKSREYEEDLHQQSFELMLVLLKNYRNIQSFEEFFKIYKTSCFYHFANRARSRIKEGIALNDYEYIQSEHFESEISKRFSKKSEEDT